MSLSSSFLFLQASHTFGATNVKKLVNLLRGEKQVAFINNSKGLIQTRAAIVR